jgi:hypothetical protein
VSKSRTLASHKYCSITLGCATNGIEIAGNGHRFSLYDHPLSHSIQPIIDTIFSPLSLAPEWEKTEPKHIISMQNCKLHISEIMSNRIERRQEA